MHLKTVEIHLKGYSRAKAEPMSNLKAMGEGRGNEKCMLRVTRPPLTTLTQPTQPLNEKSFPLSNSAFAGQS